MGAAADLINAGFGGYAGWSDLAASDDFTKTHGTTKWTGSGSQSGKNVFAAQGIALPASTAAGSSTSSPYTFAGAGTSPFGFNYEDEAKKAYGELGAYYGRILSESQGDLKLALARLVQDYDRGVRIKREDTSTAKQGYDLQEFEQAQRKKQAMEAATGNAIDRGIYSQSQFTPNQPGAGFGVGDTYVNNIIQPFTNAAQRISTARSNTDRNLARYEEGATIQKQRQEYDLPLKQSRYEADLEQQRRKEAASITNERYSRSYNDYLAKQNQF